MKLARINKFSGLGVTQEEMLAEQNAGFDSGSGSNSFNFDSLFQTLGTFAEKVAVPLYTQSQVAKQQAQQQEYQYKIAQLQAQSASTFPRIPSIPGMRSPIYSQGGGGFNFVPVLVFGGLGLAAFILLRK